MDLNLVMQVIVNYGVPAVIAIYLVFRHEQMINQLQQTVDKLNDTLMRLEWELDRIKEKIKEIEERKEERKNVDKSN